MNSTERQLRKIHAGLRACNRCPGMYGTPVHGTAFETQIMLLGQAPGIHEAALGRPFAYTAGRTLFKWMKQATGADEDEFRALVYFSAVARCFPGKAKSGAGDRVPNPVEIENCRPHMLAEIRALNPKVILAVGRLAIETLLAYLPVDERALRKAPLMDLVGRIFRIQIDAMVIEVIPLPHPSGVSRWPQSDEGKAKLVEAFQIIQDRFRLHST